MKKFTLIELLTVIAIIAILLSMLMPRLNEARKQAMLTVSMSNNKQIITGSFGYITKNKNKLPPARSNQNIRIAWDDVLSPYLGYELTQAEMESSAPSYRKDFDVLKCPLDNLTRINSNYSTRTYQLNDFQNTGQGVNRMFEYLGSTSMYLAEIDQPTETIMFNEQSKSHNFVGSEMNVTMYSNNGNGDFSQVVDTVVLNGGVRFNPNHHSNNFKNVLGFIDGHVRLMSMPQTRLDDKYLWKSKKP
jgi:prepilin-type N-terminal cleavage/methylation domain-containing protein